MKPPPPLNHIPPSITASLISFLSDDSLLLKGYLPTMLVVLLPRSAPLLCVGVPGRADGQTGGWAGQTGDGRGVQDTFECGWPLMNCSMQISSFTAKNDTHTH